MSFSTHTLSPMAYVTVVYIGRFKPSSKLCSHCGTIFKELSLKDRSWTCLLTTAERGIPVTVSPTGKMMKRMVFYGIKPDSFDWSWEVSTDGGKTWKQNWLIHYSRKK